MRKVQPIPQPSSRRDFLKQPATLAAGATVPQTTRREFLSRSAATGAVIGLSGFSGHQIQAAEPLVKGPLVKGMPNADKLGWRVGFSAYTFRALTLFETLDKIADVGLHFAELFAWQKLSPKHADARPGPGLSKELRSDLKKKAADLGVRLIGCYTGLGSPEAAKKFFEFAADMEFEVIVSEPPLPATLESKRKSPQRSGS